MGSLLLWSQNASFLVPVLEVSAVGCRVGGWVGEGVEVDEPEQKESSSN